MQARLAAQPAPGRDARNQQAGADQGQRAERQAGERQPAVRAADDHGADTGRALGTAATGSRPRAVAGPALAPSPPQQPRPPLIIGSRSITGRTLAVQRGDCWSSYALTGEGSVEDIAEKTARRNNELDERCAEIGRDPRTLRRSLVMWPPLDPWASTDGFKRIVEAFLPTGINEFAVMWPGDDRRALLEHAAEAITGLRAGSLR